MAKRTKQKSAVPKRPGKSARCRTKNAGGKSETRIIPSKVLSDIFSGLKNEPLLFNVGSRRPPKIRGGRDWLGKSEDIQLEMKPSGLLARGKDAGTNLILPTDTDFLQAFVKGKVRPGTGFIHYPRTEEDMSIRATPDWSAPSSDAINAIEQWTYADPSLVGAMPVPQLMVLPSKQRSKEQSERFAKLETMSAATQHGRTDLLPQVWTPDEVAAAQEAISDATGHEFGEFDPAFVAPVTEEGVKMLEDIFKEGVAPKRSANPQVLHVTARMKKIAAQIDRQLATLPQGAILTDRQVEQILAALSS